MNAFLISRRLESFSALCSLCVFISIRPKSTAQFAKVSKMSLAHFTGASAFLIVCLMGAAWAAPTTPSSGSQSNIEPDSQANDELHEINATTENQSSESAATTLGVELTSEFPEDVKCRSAWQKFLVSSLIMSSKNCSPLKYFIF